MDFFQSASSFTIKGGNFANVARDQHNFNHVQGTLVQYLNRKEFRERTIWDEYTRVPMGRIYVKRTLGGTDVRNVNNRSRTHRIINIASIQGEDGDSEFLVVSYSGQNASKAFERDFKKFSRVRNVNIAQLFGYNDGRFALPTLIFYDALVPVSRIWERNQFSPLLYTYFQYQFGLTQITNSIVDLRELWIHPRTGALCEGPYVDNSNHRSFVAFGLETDSVATKESALLHVEAYSDYKTLLSYLIQTLSSSNIIRGIRYSNRSTEECVDNQDGASMLSSLPGMIYNRAHRDIIARWPGNDKVAFRILACAFIGRHAGKQFTVTPPEIRDLWVGLYHEIRPQAEWNKFADSWLLQAHGVFDRCRIQEDEWEAYSTPYAFELDFRCENEYPSPRSHNISVDKPLYLFIRPRETIQESWTEGTECFWSFDPSGQEELSEDDRVSLELPFFRLQVIVLEHLYWDRTAYNAIQQLHAFNGFDHTTTDFAQSLGHPVLQVVGDETRFEEIEEAGDLQPSCALDKSKRVKRLRVLTISPMLPYPHTDLPVNCLQHPYLHLHPP
ncbi:hypothetical protein WG66_010847 [Moniliophthora roreri]|nr:hypothetical protein WG66_010847 [Moniliophthora roreri]